jgi:hypothetical protein
LPGTCFSCAERKKKCRYTLGKSVVSGHAAGPIKTAAEKTQSDIPRVSTNFQRESVTLSSTGARDHTRLNSDVPADCANGQNACTHPPAPQALGSPSDTADSCLSAAPSMLEGDFDLPPTRTIRSSSLVTGGAPEVQKDRNAKRPRVAYGN